MIDLDEDALICDLAETYHIYDYRSLPLQLVATLSAGLRDDSRIKLKAAGVPVSQDTLLLASIADRVEMFRCSFIKDAKQPESFLRAFLGDEEKKNNSVTAFNSAEEFDRRYAELTRK